MLRALCRSPELRTAADAVRDVEVWALTTLFASHGLRVSLKGLIRYVIRQ